jgi:hypothetical protein
MMTVLSRINDSSYDSSSIEGSLALTSLSLDGGRLIEAVCPNLNFIVKTVINELMFYISILHSPRGNWGFKQKACKLPPANSGHQPSHKRKRHSTVTARVVFWFGHRNKRKACPKSDFLSRTQKHEETLSKIFSFLVWTQKHEESLSIKIYFL